MRYSKIFQIMSLAALLAACENEAADVSLKLVADKTEVSVGETVTFSISQDVDGLTLYNGDTGHNYLLSADYLLQGKTAQELQEQNFRPLDPDVFPFVCDLAESEEGSTAVKDGLVEVRNANSGDNLLGSEATIAYDDVAGQNVVKINSTHPDWWYQAIRVNTDMKLGSNKTLTLRMRFDKDYLEDIYTGAISSDITTFPVVIRLGGVPEGSDEVIFSDNTVWDIYWNPSTGYADYTVDLSRIIPEWETGTGRKMARLAYAQLLFTASGSIGYVGNIYLQKVTYSDYDFLSFDTGEALSTGNGPGVVTYQHVYSEPGTYHVVLLGTNTSLKNYKNGTYKDGLGDRISGDEYNYKTVKREIDITVR